MGSGVAGLTVGKAKAMEGGMGGEAAAHGLLAGVKPPAESRAVVSRRWGAQSPCGAGWTLVLGKGTTMEDGPGLPEQPC